MTTLGDRTRRGHIDGQPSAANRATAGRDHPKATESSDAGALVCVVDDDESVRDSFRTLLESLGFTVTTYASGRDILDDDRRREASLFIVDHHMPEMDGLATLRGLLCQGSSVPTILMTGRLDPKIAARATALNVDAILEKPFSVARLMELIRTHSKPNR